MELHLGKTKGLSKHGRHGKAHLCHGAALGGRIIRVDAGFASMSAWKGHQGQASLQVSGFTELCLKCHKKF